jgi:hypothetical protein
MRSFNLILAFTVFLFLSCKQNSKPAETTPEKDLTKEVDAICECVKSYKVFEEKKELLKFTSGDVDLINDVVALEIEMNECLSGKTESYKNQKSDLDPLLEKKCPAAVKLLN